MKTWIRTENGVVKQVMVCADLPAGEDTWEEYPYPCDLAGAGARGAINVAGMILSDFDSQGNLPGVIQPEAMYPEPEV